MKPYEQLDYTLERCKHIGVRNIIQRDLGVDDSRMNQLIERLIKDKYIERYYGMYSAESYRITFEGEMFVGYVQSFRDDRRDAILKALELWMIAIGAGVSGAYCIFQTVLWICRHA